MVLLVDLRSEAGALDDPLRSLGSEARAQLQEAANGVIEDIMLTDLVLLRPPGQLAAAALRAACRTRGIDCSRFLAAVASRAAAVAAVGRPHDPAAELSCALDAIDAALAQHRSLPSTPLERLQVRPAATGKHA